jgi:hypothetical protein
MKVPELQNNLRGLRVEEASLGIISSRLIMSLRGRRQVTMKTEGPSCSEGCDACPPFTLIHRQSGELPRRLVQGW